MDTAAAKADESKRLDYNDVSELIKRFAAVSEDDIERLIRQKELGQVLSFEPARNSIELTIQLCKQMAATQWWTLPPGAVADVRNAFNGWTRIMEQMQTFEPNWKQRSSLNTSCLLPNRFR